MIEQPLPRAERGQGQRCALHVSQTHRLGSEHLAWNEDEVGGGTIAIEPAQRAMTTPFPTEPPLVSYTGSSPALNIFLTSPHGRPVERVGLRLVGPRGPCR